MLVITLLIIGSIYYFNLRSVVNQTLYSLNSDVNYFEYLTIDFMERINETFNNILLITDIENVQFEDNQFLEKFLAEHDEISSLTILSNDGKVQFSFPFNKTYIGLDFSNLNLYKNSTAQIQYSDVVINNLTGNHEVYLTNKKPLYTLLASFIIADDLYEKLDLLQIEEFDLKIIDRKNTVMFSSNNRYLYNQPNIVKNTTIYFQNNAFQVSTVKNIYGETRFFIERKVEPLGWSIKFSVNKSYFNSFYYPTYLVIAFISILLFTFMLAFVYYFKFKINSPLIYLNHHFDQISEKKQIPFNPPESSLIELNELYDHYERMHTNIIDRERELNQFVYIASHDLQEPLRMISSYIKILEMEYFQELDDEGKKYFKYVVDGAVRMKTLIQDLLLYSRAGAEYQIKSVDLNTLFSEIIEEMNISISESDANISITQLPVIKGDKDRLTQLFMNLLSNSIKYRKIDCPLTIKIYYDNKNNELIIQDNGIGVDEKYLEDIFLPFKKLHSSSDYRGTGIGLAICSKVAINHGWKIYAASSVEGGLMIKINLNNKEEKK